MPAATAEHQRSVAIALEELDGIAETDVDIASFTTYRVGGAADVFVVLRDRSDVERVARAHQRSGLPLLMIGRGSNLLVADGGFRGIAVSAVDLTSTIEIDETEATVLAGGGVLLPVLARRTAAAGLTGLEWAVGVPGTVGGAVTMNAGGHGSDISATLVGTTVAHLGATDGEIIEHLPVDRLGLRFRGSGLAETDLVLDARMRLQPGDRSEAERTISEIVRWRRENQPGGQNAGSVFVNPVPGEVTSGALIDRVGLRGLRHGTAFVSDKHANFIQADEDGSADDVRELMRIVRAKVAEETGYVLRSEIRLIGFDDGV